MFITTTSFTTTTTDTDGTERGTVEVTLRRETRRVEAVRMTNGTIIARGLTGRYQFGGKAWPATVRVDADGREFVWFGRDDRSGRFNKANGLYFS